jgi:hypothetical protein
MAYFNSGNAQFQKQEFMRAIESYKKALELNPGDVDAKYNLELSRVMLKEQLKRQPQDKNQQQQQQDQQQQQQQQDQQKPEDQKDQNGKNDQQQQQEAKDQGKNDQQQQAAQEKQGKKDEMSKEDAMRILRAMGDSEKETQKGVKRQYSQSSYKGKDW